MRKIVAEVYNDDRHLRIKVFERENGAFSYFFEYMVTWPDMPTTDSWLDDLKTTSGVYDSIDHAIAAAKSDTVWAQKLYPH